MTHEEEKRIISRQLSDAALRGRVKSLESELTRVRQERDEAREDAAKWKGVVRDIPLDQGYCYLYCHDSSHDADCPWLLAQEPEKPETQHAKRKCVMDQ